MEGWRAFVVWREVQRERRMRPRLITPNAQPPPLQERLESARTQLAAARQAAKDKSKEIAAIDKEMAQTKCVLRAVLCCFGDL